MAGQSARLFDGSSTRFTTLSTGSLSGGYRYVTDEDGNDFLAAPINLSNPVRIVDAKFPGGDGLVLVKP